MLTIDTDEIVIGYPNMFELMWDLKGEENFNVKRIYKHYNMFIRKDRNKKRFNENLIQSILYMVCKKNFYLQGWRKIMQLGIAICICREIL